MHWGVVISPREWQPVSRGARIAWLLGYALFLLHLATDADGFPLTHPLNLVIHEGGHFLFGWFGATLGVLGGTLAEMLVPLLLAVAFVRQRHAPGVAFCAFWMFHTFPGTAAYMADARTLALPLVGSGDHDWELLFTQWNVLHLDRAIAAVVRVLGWTGMLTTVAWLAWIAQPLPRAGK